MSGVGAWLILFHKEAATAKAALDCPLCRTALPALRRAAPRLLAAGVRVAPRIINRTPPPHLSRRGPRERAWALLWGGERLSLPDLGVREPRSGALAGSAGV